MFRVGIVKKDGEVISKNFNDKGSAETWILEQTNIIKKAVLLNIETKEREIMEF